jgi:hypothetical protein
LSEFLQLSVRHRFESATLVDADTVRGSTCIASVMAVQITERRDTLRRNALAAAMLRRAALCHVGQIAGFHSMALFAPEPL